MSSAPVKLGVLSTANIAKTILNALERVPTCTVTAVASRDISKAENFAKTHDIPTFCTYEALLTQPVDAIYIPLPTALAADWAVRCARAGKHVLVDKPLTSADAIEQILQACKENGVFYMDATHFVHAKRSKIVRERIKDGVIGDVKRVVTTFGFPIRLSGNIRADPSLEPMTALGDLGWYTVRSAVTYLGVERTANVMSLSCEAKYLQKYAGAIECVKGVVVFGTGEGDRFSLCFVADQNCSFEQTVVIQGTTGHIEIPEFVVPHKQTDILAGLRRPELYTTNTELITIKTVSGIDAGGEPVPMYPTKEVEVVEEDGDLSQPAAMMREFGRMIQEKDSEAAHRWASESLNTQKVLDMAFKEIQTRNTQ